MSVTLSDEDARFIFNTIMKIICKPPFKPKGPELTYDLRRSLELLGKDECEAEKKAELLGE